MDSNTRDASETHRQLLKLLALGQVDQDALMARLSPEERAAGGEPQAWAAKDQIAHNNFWRYDAALRLQAALDGGTPPDREDDDTENERNFQAQREMPWEQLVAETARLRQETAALIQRLNPDELTQEGRYPWQRGSLATMIFINWYDHPSEHWTEVYLGRGDVDLAIELRRAAATTASEFFAPDLTIYSYMMGRLGGYCVRGGRPEQAIDALREALRVNPSLVEYIEKDTDLDPLRAFPAFQALIPS